jgi:A/G-specific adenine glycosylase
MPSKSTPLVPPLAPAFRRRLLAWFRRHGRDLAWRKTRDPYRVLVSEVMLQQTQVSRVEEYYPRFLDRFPTLQHLAAARPGRVREEWDGLGYYRRAANLHRLAREVVARHDGRIPDRVDALRRLPGVGPYTAGAVASFAFERAVPAVDTNVARVLRRAFHPRLKSGAHAVRTLWATAAAILPARGKTAWAFNQAIMELGAMICTARVAKCGECPVSAACITGKRQRSTVNGQRDLPRRVDPLSRGGSR